MFELYLTGMEIDYNKDDFGFMFHGLVMRRQNRVIFISEHLFLSVVYILMLWSWRNRVDADLTTN